MFQKMLTAAWSLDAEQCAYTMLSLDYQALTETQAAGVLRYLTDLAATELPEAEKDLARKDLLQSLILKFRGGDGAVDLTALEPFVTAGFQSWAAPFLSDVVALYQVIQSISEDKRFPDDGVEAAVEDALALCHGDVVYETMARRALLSRLLWRASEPGVGPIVRTLAGALAEAERGALESAVELLADLGRYL